MNNNKTFVGNAKLFETQYGHSFSVEVGIDELKNAITAAREHGLTRTFVTRSGEREVIKLTFWGMKDPKPYATHYGVLEDANRNKEKVTGDDVAAAATSEEDDLPF